MDKVTGTKAVEILQALLDGKAVQVRAKSPANEEWEDYVDDEAHYPGVFSDFQEWRVKPVARRFWIKVLDGNVHTVHETRVGAECAFRGRNAEMFEVMEVL